MVVSRIEDVDDIDPNLGSAIIIDIIHRLPVHVKQHINFEISRPGTWSAFEKSIKMRTEQWWASGGDGPWFDLVHFDTHGIIYEGQACLLFLSNDGLSINPRPTSRIVSTIRKYEVPFVFLNSCESAKALGTVESNLACALVHQGVPSVLAMSYKFTSVAAKLYIMFFYQALFRLRGKTIHLAAKIARQAISINNSRTAVFNSTAQLPDYVIPVLYTNLDLGNSDLGVSTGLGQLPVEKTGIDYSSIASDIIAASDEISQEEFFTGRQHTVSALEWQLLSKWDTNVMLVQGMAGTGKTALFRHLSAWWEKTGFTDSTNWFDMKTSQPRECLSFLESLYQKLSASNDEETKRPNLVVIDSIEALNWPFPSGNQVQRRNSQRGLQAVISRLRGLRVFVLLGSRCRERWLQLDDHQYYKLNGLPHSYALEYAVAILQNIERGEDLRDTEKAAYLRYLIAGLDHNPVAIRTLLTSLILRNQSLEELCDRIQLQCVYLIDKDPAVAECIDFASQLLSDTSVNPTREQQAKQLITLGLANFNNVFCEDWYGSMVVYLEGKKLGIDINFVQKFVDDYFLASGWAEPITDEPSLSSERGIVTHRYIRIHPLLTQCLRLVAWERCSREINEEVRPDLVNMHIDYYRHKIFAWAELPSNELTMGLVGIELMNLLAILEGLCTGVLLDGQRFGLTATLTLHLIFSCFAQQNNLLFPMQVPFKRSQILMDALSASSDAQLLRFESMSVAFNLAEHFQDQNPRRAVKHAESILATFFCMMAETRGRLPPHDHVVFDRVSRTLIIWGNIATMDNKPFVAEVAFRLALAIESTFMTATGNFGASDKLEVRYHALRGLSFIIQDPQQQEQYRRKRLATLKEDTILMAQRHNTFDISPSGAEPTAELPTRSIWTHPDPSDSYIEFLDFLMCSWHIKREGPSVINGILGIELIDAMMSRGNQSQNALQQVCTRGLRAAIQKGSKPEEFLYRSLLVSCAIENKEWGVAARHILLQNELERQTQHGPWIWSTLLERKWNTLRAACVFLRIRRLDLGVKFFGYVLTSETDETGGNDAPRELSLDRYQSPYEFVNQVSFIVETGLMYLFKYGLREARIDGNEYQELRDISQTLIREEFYKRWPNYEDEILFPLVVHED
jgi:hypothetical protein